VGCCLNKTKILAIVVIPLITLSYQNCAMVSDDTSLQASSGTPTNEELEAKAFGIIQRKCVSCHNAEIPSGGIDNLTDLSSLFYYRLVVPKEPQLSSLYTSVVNGSMPPEKSLTTSEVRIINDWILTGLANDNTPPVPPPSTTPVVLGPNYASIRALILLPRCVACHNGTTRTDGGVNLSTYAGVMNVVQAGNINASSLYTETLSGSMPRNSASLTTAQMAAIKGWIEAGARQ